MKMKKLCVILLAALSLAGMGLGAAQSQSSASDHPVYRPYSVAIKTDAQEVKSGSKVAVDVALTNATDRTVVAPPAELEAMRFVVIVSQEAGDPLAPTDRGKEWNRQGGWSGSGPIFPMEPGTTTHRKIIASDLYDMTRPGKYSIQLQRNDMSSNTITVTILP
jgi:hypothetical protein